MKNVDANVVDEAGKGQAGRPLLDLQLSVTFCIDTSALLDGWVRYYPLGVFPPLWKNLDQMVEPEELIDPDEVLHELSKKEDDLHACAQRQSKMFQSLEAHARTATQAVLDQFPRLVDSGTDRGCADPFVIAPARVREFSVGTGERRVSTPNRPRIPLVCQHFSIPCMNLLARIRRKGWQFR